MNESTDNHKAEVLEAVRKRYSEAALEVLRGHSACGSGRCCDHITGGLYTASEASLLPEEAVLASLGCGNPTALGALKEGEIVLDLGSGGGADALLAANAVGPRGFVYGLDMTGEMLKLAERNREKAGVQNVRFVKATIERIPLLNESVDVIISNCVINLSADKDAVFSEAYRVLRPGGRLAISDVVVNGHLPADVRKDIELHVGCIAGALELSDYLERLKQAGFEEVSIEPTRRYEIDHAFHNDETNAALTLLPAEERKVWDGRVTAAFVSARKPTV